MEFGEFQKRVYFPDTGVSILSIFSITRTRRDFKITTSAILICFIRPECVDCGVMCLESYDNSPAMHITSHSLHFAKCLFLEKSRIVSAFDIIV